MRLENLSWLLEWLEEQPGATWQERWVASGADAAGASWRDGLVMWLEGKGLPVGWRKRTLASALLGMIGADIVRPSLGWLAVKPTGPGSLVRCLEPGATRTGSPGSGRRATPTRTCRRCPAAIRSTGLR